MQSNHESISSAVFSTGVLGSLRVSAREAGVVVRRNWVDGTKVESRRGMDGRVGGEALRSDTTEMVDLCPREGWVRRKPLLVGDVGPADEDGLKEKLFDSPFKSLVVALLALRDQLESKRRRSIETPVSSWAIIILGSSSGESGKVVVVA